MSTKTEKVSATDADDISPPALPPPTPFPVLAAQAWNTNADLINDCARLGYLKFHWNILDPTYGRGGWWKSWRPKSLVMHDIKKDNVDFRNLPEPNDYFDAVAYDPPYVSVGGRSTSTIPDFLDRYGMVETPTSPATLQVMINDGLQEVYRVLKPRESIEEGNGIGLVKCQDYISSGNLWLGTHYTLTAAIDIGFKVIDRFEHIGSPRAQPKRSRQVHARRNLSTLFVLQKGST